MNYNDIIYWNSKAYGQAYKIDKYSLKAFIITLGFVIPVFLPVPLMIYLSSKIKNNIVYRW